MNRGDVATHPCFEIQSNLLEWGVAGSIRGASRILVAPLTSTPPGSIKANENSGIIWLLNRLAILLLILSRANASVVGCCHPLIRIVA